MGSWEREGPQVGWSGGGFRERDASPFAESTRAQRMGLGRLGVMSGPAGPSIQLARASTPPQFAVVFYMPSITKVMDGKLCIRQIA